MLYYLHVAEESKVHVLGLFDLLVLDHWELKGLAEKAGEELNWEREGAKLVSLYERLVVPRLAPTKVPRSAGGTAAALTDEA